MARLSLVQRAQIIATEKPTDPARMDALTSDLSDEEVQTLAELLGIGGIANVTGSLLLRILPRALAVAQASLAQQSPENDDSIDALIRRMDLSTLEDPATTPPPSSPELPVTPPRRPPGPKSEPSTPARRTPLYHTVSSSTEGYAHDWLIAGAASQGVPGGTVRAAVRSPHHKKAPAAAYVLFFGGAIDVYLDWISVQKQIRGVANAYQSGFPSRSAAEKALAYARAQGWTGDSAVPQPALPVPSSYLPNPLNSPSSGQPDRWYAVARGMHPGIYSSGLECHLNITGHRNALHKLYVTRAEAEAALAAYNQKMLENGSATL